MNSTHLKKLLKQQIEEADDRLLKVIHAMMEAYQDTDETFSYDTQGNSINADEMKKEFEQEVKNAKKGKHISLSDLKKESEEWMKTE